MTKVKAILPAHTVICGRSVHICERFCHFTHDWVLSYTHSCIGLPPSLKATPPFFVIPTMQNYSFSQLALCNLHCNLHDVFCKRLIFRVVVFVFFARFCVVNCGLHHFHLQPQLHFLSIVIQSEAWNLNLPLLFICG